MKKILLLLIILFVSVMTTACVNNFAIKELNNKAEDYLNKGDTETAICRLKSSLDLDAEVLETHYKLAVAYNNLGRYDESIEELNKVMALDDEYFLAYYTMANVKEKMAYEALYKNFDENTSYYDLDLDNLSDFSNLAQEAVEAYNQYLIRDVKATDTTEVNSKITELNSKIKEVGVVYDKRIPKDEINTEEKKFRNKKNKEAAEQAETPVEQTETNSDNKENSVTDTVNTSSGKEQAPAEETLAE
jgi:tetratricopeptide (TPR) repeat protein